MSIFKRVLFLLLMSACFIGAFAQTQKIKVGVLAHRGKDVAVKMWQPTMSYLKDSIGDSEFELVPLNFQELTDAVKSKSIDFVLTNTGQYIELEASYGISRIVTMRNDGPKGCVCNRFGGVFLTRAGSEIQTIGDIKGKTLLSVDKSSFGGWLMQLRELKSAGIDPQKDLEKIVTLGNHEKVVMGVLSGEGDVGAVRTDILERMHNEGKIDLSKIKILDEKHFDGFPYVTSTRLYPEWPFARLRHTDEKLATMVAISLLALDESSSAAKAAKIIGWTVPQDYSSVHELYKELKIGPYKDLGKFSLMDVVKKYWLVILLVTAFMIHLVGSLMKVRRMNSQLKASEALIQQEKAALEETHAKLDKANSLVMESIHYARKIQEASLPNKHALDDSIKDIFICWEPLHVVGGDYFWLERIDSKSVIIIVDCTGHGVPGAFMTMVVASAISRALHDLKLLDPASILLSLDETVRSKLRQDYPDTDSDDGLDCAVCIYDESSRTLTFAGANLPLVVVKNGELEEIKPTRASLGYKSIRPKSGFENHVIEVVPDMSFYMLTDGIPDHMGGVTKRLLGRKRLGSIILENTHLPMIAQMHKIEEALEEYRAHEPRRDDMTLIGFKPL